MADAVQKAYAAVRGAIVAGEIPPGGRVREEHFAARAGVSRTPVREALRRLNSDGFVELHPNRGARVMSWSTKDLDEVFELRALLESYGTQLAASQIDEAQLEALDDLAERMIRLAEDDGALDGIAEWNNEFHSLILTASGSRQLGAIVGGLLHLPLIHRTFHVYSEAALRRSLHHHREIVEALRARDGEWAGSVMRAHIHAAHCEVRKAISSGASVLTPGRTAEGDSQVGAIGA